MPAPAELAEALRHALRRPAASLAVVAALDAGGHPVGLTVSSVTSVSLSPPSMLVCINRQASAHAGLSQCPVFALSYLTEAQQDVASAFAFEPDMERRFATGTWVVEHGAPVLVGALVRLWCRPLSQVEIGSHSILIGTVLRAEEAPGAPLLWQEGGFRHLALP